ncbi:hypothetical protein [Tropicibacter oceani]|uniref:Lipoprotein n=1 Tax=Tropicibacter oceani TaxID=3058420 RepID=A0ABY8QCU2_9RHOB|nr:hypothetical protein [Tropicibacter oceani]WGW02248.1 hypothetical protein QF118_09780 [Tropicibacter oceani]
MLGRTFRRLVLMLTAAALLTACQLDTEQEARAIVAPWIFLAETEQFTSEKDCTVARFAVVSQEVRRTRGPVLMTSVRAAIPLLQDGQTVAFDIPGVTPNQVSEQLMSINLFKGLGMLASFVGPGKRCMDDAFAADAYSVLMSPDTMMIYDPVTYSMVLLYKPAKTAFFMRTKS